LKPTRNPIAEMNGKSVVEPESRVPGRNPDCGANAEAVRIRARADETQAGTSVCERSSQVLTRSLRIAETRQQVTSSSRCSNASSFSSMSPSPQSPAASLSTPNAVSSWVASFRTSEWN
jgi:hypothetical protein